MIVDTSRTYPPQVIQSVGVYCHRFMVCIIMTRFMTEIATNKNKKKTADPMDVAGSVKNRNMRRLIDRFVGGGRLCCW